MRGRAIEPSRIVPNRMNWKLELALFSCAVLGLRHGFDYDHLAAISDITAVQENWRRSMRLGVTYALGHALTVVVLGALVVMLHIPLPAKLDNWAERLIGATLIVLGIGVVTNLIKHSHSRAAMRSRWAILISGCQYAWWRVSTIFQANAPKPEPFTWSYNGGSVFAIGILHGLGAETPSQLMLFLLAASLGGTVHGFMGLIAFAAGLVAMNTLMTASLGGIFGAGLHRPTFYRWVAVAGAVYSFAIGVIFLLGSSDRLPALGG
jgi:high-affinity nickel permease